MYRLMNQIKYWESEIFLADVSYKQKYIYFKIKT